MLEVHEIDTFYGNAHVLFGISLRVGAGECVSLLGRNGAGKTTTLRSIMGLNAPRRGTIRFKAEEIHGRVPYRIARSGIALVPEDRRIFPVLTVEENLRLGEKKGAGTARWTLERVYEVFPKLKVLRERSGGNLSGGEQQMLTIARALMGNPDLIMLDEPTEGLAPIVVEELVHAIARLKREAMTVLLVEQNINVALALADRCYVLDHGSVVAEGPADTIRADEQLRADLLGV
ncbi:MULTISPECIES: ABC transporter ATP-binding protein [unclassified Xanthobacter]|uniref:ABC transporter ATP-binding protein n=1 Tax=unclassified Xanthobacter TaxID=2623496 RepID=UPI001EDECB01|nr:MULTISPECIES: ABC transporter ATP-binding protein [unclassified Xanthobacter]